MKQSLKPHSEGDEPTVRSLCSLYRELHAAAIALAELHQEFVQAQWHFQSRLFNASNSNSETGFEEE